jgi:hypothetical protein
MAKVVLTTYAVIAVYFLRAYPRPTALGVTASLLWPMSLMLGLSACSSMPPEDSSEPVGEEMFGGDNRDMDPAHQEEAGARAKASATCSAPTSP